MGGHKGQVVGYVRVSAADQNEARQLDALGAVDRLFSEKVSGKSAADRAQLQEMLAYVREGDKVRVKSPDRLARSTTDLLALVERLKAKGVALEFVDTPALNTDTPPGRAHAHDSGGGALHVRVGCGTGWSAAWVRVRHGLAGNAREEQR